MVYQGKLACLQGAGRDDSTSDNMLLRGCERTNCSPAGGSTVRCKTSGFRLMHLSFACFIRQRPPGQHSRYSDSLLAARSRGRIPVEAKFPVPSRPAPSPTQSPVQ